ncbi:MAG: hypothetical protein FIA94_06440 [Nitrospirae bacterium]|nr:hypothetical protein [Nitrospirota bacterium]
MVRAVTQLLVALMLLFGVLTLFPKAFMEFRAGKIIRGCISVLLGLCAGFFAGMAFYYAYLIFRY